MSAQGFDVRGGSELGSEVPLSPWLATDLQITLLDNPVGLILAIIAWTAGKAHGPPPVPLSLVPGVAVFKTPSK